MFFSLFPGHLGAIMRILALSLLKSVVNTVLKKKANCSEYLILHLGAMVPASIVENVDFGKD